MQEVKTNVWKTNDKLELEDWTWHWAKLDSFLLDEFWNLKVVGDDPLWSQILLCEKNYEIFMWFLVIFF